MKPIPHLHNCPACECSWECYNPLCEDLTAHWCRDLCKVCADPPEAVYQARKILDAAEEMLHAAHVVEHHGGDPEIAEEIRTLRKRLQWKAGHLTASRGAVRTPPVSSADSTHSH